ncbi:unnamed protein product [Gongylonema pulchrum]|uniref:Cation-transporting P-type ATPase N-terminal domain-containing protein n=1 Tax=Gongylonema pulchrum TaxID=637853 RepID=A0A3P6NMT3_9BILA|nr:unnamed protein product [Gongylonema pulchrum]
MPLKITEAVFHANLNKQASKTDYEFGCTLEELRQLMDTRRAEAVVKLNNDYGGVEELCRKLHVDPAKGISSDAQELAKRRAIFGANTIPAPSSRSFIRLIWEASKDPTLVILLVAGFISLALSFYAPASDQDDEQLSAYVAHSWPSYLNPNVTFNHNTTYSKGSIPHFTHSEMQKDEEHGTAWIEGAAILICVIVVVLVTAINDYSKERQFRGLQEKIETGHKFSVIRSGEPVDVPVADLVVGDVARVKYGDLLPADGFIIQSHDLKVDESPLTGESEHVSKGVDHDPVLLSGTYAMEGSGKMLITAVGVNSQSGIIMALLGRGKLPDNISESSSG